MVAPAWRGEGLAEDVRHYGRWIRNEAEKRIGHLYPQVEITTAVVRERPDLKSYTGQKLTVIPGSTYALLSGVPVHDEGRRAAGCGRGQAGMDPVR